jgi:hypothetical protein
MKLRKHLTIGLALIGLALGLTTARANAQTAIQGTFELPAAAYFGDTLLQPGQYTIRMSVSSADTHVPAFHLSGEGINATFLAVAKPAQESGRNFLEIANVDGTYVIRAFDAGSIGESFAFGVTKNVKNKALRASAEPPSIAVPVSE